MAIKYLKGDATQPCGEGNKILVHCCNNVGAWGAGFVKALSRRWPAPERAYRAWFVAKAGFELGQIQLVKVEPDLQVANLIGQRGIRGPGNETPVVYDAIRYGLRRVATAAKAADASVHMPRMGCGLAGGTWDQMEPIIEETLDGLSVYVYDLE